MSSRTRGAAVAVSAMNGTPASASRSSPSRLRPGRGSAGASLAGPALHHSLQHEAATGHDRRA